MFYWEHPIQELDRPYGPWLQPMAPIRIAKNVKVDEQWPHRKSLSHSMKYCLVDRDSPFLDDYKIPNDYESMKGSIIPDNHQPTGVCFTLLK